MIALSLRILAMLAGVTVAVGSIGRLVLGRSAGSAMWSGACLLVSAGAGAPVCGTGCLFCILPMLSSR